MKNIVKVLLCILILICVTGCNSNNYDENKLNIVTSFYPMYVATANIVDGVEDITLTNLTSTEVGCLHDYQLTTANLILLEKSDVLVVNGGGMENFIQKAIDNCENLQIINSSEGILEEHEEEHEENHDEEHHHEEHHHGENAHIWVSASMYIDQVENIRDSLVSIDEKNAKQYIENANKYIEKLEQLKSKMHMGLDNVEYKNIVTFHEAFEFFAEEFGLNVVAVIEREPGTYPSAGEIAEIINTVKDTDAKAIFVEPQYPETAANTIARETEVDVYTLDPIVSGNLEKDAYEKIMIKNLETLVEALEG